MNIVDIHIGYGICELAYWFPKISVGTKETTTTYKWFLQLVMDNRIET